MQNHLGEVAALATAFCWTITALSFEGAGKKVGSLSVNLIRLILALVFLMVFCALTRGLALPTDATPHAWFWLGISGLVGFTFGDLCLFRAFVVLGSRLSTLMMSLVPPISAVLGMLLLGEHLSMLNWTGMGITLTGIVWVILGKQEGKQNRKDQQSYRWGVLLAFGGAVGQAAGLVTGKLGMGAYHPFAATQIRIIAGIAGFAVLFTAIGWWKKFAVSFTNSRAMAQISVGSFFGPFLGVSFSLAAIQLTKTGVAATIMAIVPVLIIPPAILFFKERISLRSLLGSVVTVVGVGVLFW